ncbi:DUF1573 domain-containing protein [Alienimonas californiensis]|uniref:DUF1573 domain-containing protein n=1 Tax=Alienimonas californiensis TaxID=2527989 RepID=A0A517PEY1_9PLAN|nr:DUF1573 domain-containing protein [Alienimonas californiensis]QDT17925.1 hypothetical protein CA12_40630 [Alienimonas californiensis]
MNVLARIALVAAIVVAVGAGLYYFLEAPIAGRMVDESTEEVPGFAKKDVRFLQPDVRPAATGPHPKIEVEEPQYDFGTVALGESDSHTFVVKNVGEADLILGEPITTCKCTAPEAGTGKPIPPGESTTVTLTYTPEKVANEFAQRAFIHTNDPADPRLELEVHGSVEELLRAFPSSMLDFGVVDGKESVTKSFKVLSRLRDEIKVTGTESASDYLKVTTSPADLSEPINPGEEESEDVPEEERRPAPKSAAELGFTGGIVVTVELLPGMPIGRFRETVAVNFDEAPPDPQRAAEGKIAVDYSNMKAEVVGTVRGPFAFVPVQRENQKFLPSALAFDLGAFSADEGAKGTLQLFVDGMEEPLELTDIQSTEKYVQLEVRRDPSFSVESGRQKLFLDFVVPPGSPPAQHIRKGKVIVTANTNHPDGRKLQFFIEMASYR